MLKCFLPARFCLLIPLFFLQFQGIFAEENKVRVGLALSGGAAKGFAHVGVLKVLEEAGIPVHVLSGTSIGSIIGGMHAAGYSAQRIEKELLALDWERIFKDVPDRSELLLEDKDQFDRYIVTLPLKNRRVVLPTGLYAGQRLMELLGRLAWPLQDKNGFQDYPIPFGSLATNLETGKAHLIQSGALHEAMRASMAIPTAFTPWKIEDQIYADGLLVRNLPAQDALDMGADFLIGVDVGAPLFKKEELDSILMIFEQSISIPAAEANVEQMNLCDVYIKPDLDGIPRTDFTRVEDFIERGEEATRKILPELKKKLKDLGVVLKRSTLKEPDENREYQIEQIEILGLENLQKEYVLQETGLKFPALMSWDMVERAIHRLYNTAFFDVVTYGIQGQILTFKVEEKNLAALGVGIRYDSQQRASIFANVTARNVGFRNSRTSVDMRLGIENQLKLESTFFQFINRQWRTGIKSTLEYRELDYKSNFVGGGLKNENEYDLFSAEVMFATIRRRATGLGIGVNAEVLSRVEDSLKLPGERQSTEDFGLVAHWRKDTLNETQFPDRGEFAEFRLVKVNEGTASDSDYSFMWGIWQRFFELSERLAFSLGWKFSRLSGKDTPMHRHAFLGGFEPFREPAGFVGLRWRDRYAANMQAAQMGLHYRLSQDLLLQLRHNEGNVADAADDLYSRSNWIKGTGLSVIKDTQAGPLEIGISRSSTERFYSWIALGFRF